MAVRYRLQFRQWVMQQVNRSQKTLSERFCCISPLRWRFAKGLQLRISFQHVLLCAERTCDCQKCYYWLWGRVWEGEKWKNSPDRSPGATRSRARSSTSRKTCDGGLYGGNESTLRGTIEAKSYKVEWSPKYFSLCHSYRLEFLSWFGILQSGTMLASHWRGHCGWLRADLTSAIVAFERRKVLFDVSM